MKIYFDENFSLHIIAGMRSFQEGRRREGFTIHSVKEEFGEGVADEDWIPKVAQQHGVAITQDLNIHRMRAQWKLCQEYQLGVIFYKPGKSGWRYWDFIQITVKLWSEIKETCQSTKQPFGYVLEGMRPKLKKL